MIALKVVFFVKSGFKQSASTHSVKLVVDVDIPPANVVRHDASCPRKQVEVSHVIRVTVSPDNVINVAAF